MSFNKEGTKLATVGGSPDFTLTVWDWENEAVILKSKAFGQDVYTVSFSPSIEGILTTSGVGHIKFWKMAQTFTGLKLQGLIGKFGKVDISDVSGYAEFPDGKVLSGSEKGYLLLWEGNLIRCVFVRQQEQPCHDGMIENVFLEKNEVITAGRDGYIKFWSMDKIDTAEASDTSNIIEISPIKQIFVGQSVQIISTSKLNTHYVVQDASGGFWRVDLNVDSFDFNYNTTKILDFHSGSINDVDAAYNDYVVVSAGNDKSLRLVNFVTNTVVFKQYFSCICTRVKWNNLIVDPFLLTVTAGFEDGVIRILQRDQMNFKVIRVAKPHNKRIIDFSYTNDGKIIASCSEDNRIFYMDKEFSPIGFYPLPSMPTSLEWNAEDNGLLVGLFDGSIISIERPNPELIDTKRLTYELKLNYKKYFFHKYLKPSEPEKKVEKKEGEQEDNMITDEEQKQIEKTKQQYEEYDKAGVVFSHFSINGTLFVSVNREQGIFEYSGIWWEDPIHTMPEFPGKLLFDTPAVATVMRFSKDKKIAIIGYKNGKIDMIDTFSNSKIATTPLHDGIEGKIHGVTLSFDNSFLVSVCESGCFFVQKRIDTQSVDINSLDIPPVTNIAQDIVDPAHWTFEEALQNEEKVRMFNAREQKKQSKKIKVENIKKSFENLITLNNNNHYGKLSREELQVDPEAKERTQSKLKTKLFVAEKEIEHETLLSDFKLNKLRKQYLDNLDVERIEVVGFAKNIHITTFRTLKRSEQLEHQISIVNMLIEDEMHRRMNEADEEDFVNQSFSDSPLKLPISPGDKPGIPQNQKVVSSAVAKLEELNRLKQERKLLREELLKRKPSMNDSNEFLAKIALATANMGDYKLKTDPNFAIPEHKRPNAEKKLRQMILLLESIHTLKMVFNTRVLALKDLKVKLIDKFSRYNVQIDSINKQLGCIEKLELYSLSSVEAPEKRDEISSEQLEKFRIEKQKEEERKARKAAGKGIGLSSVDDNSNSATEQLVQQPQTISKSEAAHKEKENRFKVVQSELEKQESQIETYRLQFEKQRLISKRMKQIENFDDAIEILKFEKLKLEADLKQASIKLLLQHTELQLLKEYDIRDKALYEELTLKKQDKSNILAKIIGCQEKLLEKKREVEKIVQSEQIYVQFQQLLPESHPAYSDLYKIFKKSKLSEDDDDEDDDDEESQTSDVEDEEEEEELEDIPANCDQELFSKVIALRKKKQAQEKILDGIIKNIEALKKERETHIKTEKIIDGALKTIEKKIEVVQKEKQTKLNELTNCIFLKFSQIQGLKDHKVPKDISNLVLFTNTGLLKLSNRIDELGIERQQLMEDQLLAKKELKKLNREHEIKESHLEDQKEKTVEAQLLKFGREVDLEELENATVDEIAENLKSELKRKEDEAEAILLQYDQRIRSLKDAVSKTTQENTRYLTKLTELKERQFKLEKNLDSTQVNITTRVQKEITESNVENLRQLKELAIKRAKEIEKCKHTIALLRSKTTHFAPN